MVLDSSKLPGQHKRAETNNGSGTVLDARSSMPLMLENFGRPGENTSPQKRLGHFPQRKSSQWTCDDEKHLTPSNPSNKKKKRKSQSERADCRARSLSFFKIFLRRANPRGIRCVAASFDQADKACFNLTLPICPRPSASIQLCHSEKPEAPFP